MSEIAPGTLHKINHQHHPTFPSPLHCFIFSLETYHYLTYYLPPVECKAHQGQEFISVLSPLYSEPWTMHTVGIQEIVLSD